MRNFKMLTGAAAVVLSTFVSASARADDQVDQGEQVHDTKPGLIATGAILSVFGVGHMVIAGAAFSSAASCGGGFCFKDVDNAVGGISIAIGGALLGVGIPLIVYGSTAKRARASVGFSPNGILLSGTF